MFSGEKGFKIRAKVHGRGRIFVTSRRAWLPLLKLISPLRVTGAFLPFLGVLLVVAAHSGRLRFQLVTQADMPRLTQFASVSS